MIDFKELLDKMKNREAVRKEHPYPLIWVGTEKKGKTNVYSDAPDCVEYCILHQLDVFTPHHRIYCGRQVGSIFEYAKRNFHQESPLGNPYRVNQYGDQAIPMYKNWLWERLKEPGSMQRKEIVFIIEAGLSDAGIAITCWCAPSPCHCDIIKKAALWAWSTKTYLEWK